MPTLRQKAAYICLKPRSRSISLKLLRLLGFTCSIYPTCYVSFLTIKEAKETYTFRQRNQVTAFVLSTLHSQQCSATHLCEGCDFLPATVGHIEKLRELRCQELYIIH